MMWSGGCLFWMPRSLENWVSSNGEQDGIGLRFDFWRPQGASGSCLLRFPIACLHMLDLWIIIPGD